MNIRLSCLSDIIPALAAEAKANPNVGELMRAISSVISDGTATTSFSVSPETYNRYKAHTAFLNLLISNQTLKDFDLQGLKGSVRFQIVTNFGANNSYKRKCKIIVGLCELSDRYIEVRSEELRRYLEWFARQIEDHEAVGLQTFERWIETHPYRKEKSLSLPKIRLSRGFVAWLICLFIPVSGAIIFSTFSGYLGPFVIWLGVLLPSIAWTSQYFDEPD